VLRARKYPSMPAAGGEPGRLMANGVDAQSARNAASAPSSASVISVLRNGAIDSTPWRLIVENVIFKAIERRTVERWGMST
jgi:hypothetical protein